MEKKKHNDRITVNVKLARDEYIAAAEYSQSFSESD